EIPDLPEPAVPSEMERGVAVGAAARLAAPARRNGLAEGARDDPGPLRGSSQPAGRGREQGGPARAGPAGAGAHQCASAAAARSDDAAADAVSCRRMIRKSAKRLSEKACPRA